MKVNIFFNYLFINILLIIFFISNGFSFSRSKVIPNLQAPIYERFLVQHQAEIQSVDLIRSQLPKAKSILKFLLESRQYQNIAEKNPSELMQLLRVFLGSYRMSGELRHNLKTTFEFYLNRHFADDHKFSFEEISHLNLEILAQEVESSGPLSEAEAHFLDFFTRQRLYLKRPSYISAEKYHQGLLVSYDLFAYPALHHYLDALRSTQNWRALISEYRQLWESPTHVDSRTALITELEGYLKNIDPLPRSFYNGLPLKKSGYNASLDAPLLGNGQFVFFRLTPDSDRRSSSNMGNQFLVFTADYLDDFAVAYLSDQIDPFIQRDVEVPLENGHVLRRSTVRLTYEEQFSLDPSGKLGELNSSSTFYSVCYQSPNSRHCFSHNTANEIFYGADIRRAIGLRLILELRRIHADPLAARFVSMTMSKRTMDAELQSFMTGVLHIQALYPAIYPIQSARYLGSLGETE